MDSKKKKKTTMSLSKEVLQEWNTFKEKLAQQQAHTLTPKEMTFLKFLATQVMEESVLPIFPLGVAACRRNLARWTSADYRWKLDEHKRAIIDRDQTISKELNEPNEALEFLTMAYLDKIEMFTDLVNGWQREIEAARHSGPTIEEVD